MQYELNGLFELEVNKNNKLILPIWHSITKQEVFSFSPILSGKLALNTSIYTTDEIVSKLIEVLSIKKENIRRNYVKKSFY